MTKLYILRGNSGSGKTTVARNLRNKLGAGGILISQDLVRREMLAVKDYAENPSIALIQNLAEYGKVHFEYVIIEGILKKAKYGEMLEELLALFGNESAVYYFDVSFEETVRRHEMRTRNEKAEFNAADMKHWWLDNNYLGVPFEKIIPERWGVEETVSFIYND